MVLPGQWEEQFQPPQRGSQGGDVKVSRVASVVLSAAVDLVLVLVLVFVLIGRASHGEDPVGTLNTLWPFLVGR